MSKGETILTEKLLYDPMFDKDIELDWTDSKKGGIFGKAVVKNQFL